MGIFNIVLNLLLGGCGFILAGTVNAENRNSTGLIIEFFNGSFYRRGYLKAMVDQVRNF